MRQRAVRFHHKAGWYPDFQSEMLNFRGGNERNDQPDAAAWLGIGLDRMSSPMSEQELEMAMVRQAKEQSSFMLGRSATTGY